MLSCDNICQLPALPSWVCSGTFLWLFCLCVACVCMCGCKPCMYIFSSLILMCFAVLSCSVVSDSLRPHGLQPSRLLCPWGLSRQEYWSGLPCPPPGDRPNPGIKPRSLTLKADSLPSEPSGKPKDTSVVSLSLMQGIFLTQESNGGLLHCR